MSIHSPFKIGILFFLFLLPGCSDGRVALRGNVSVNGVPVKEGTINFRPIDVASPGSSTVIVDGSYSVAAKKGVVPGEYLVQISATEDTGKMDTSMPGPPRPIYRSLIPPKYNAQSELKVNVTRGKPCDFDLVVEEKDFEKGIVKFSGNR